MNDNNDNEVLENKDSDFTYRDMENLKLAYIDIDKWIFKELTKEEASKLIEIFSFSGLEKDYNSSLTTEPIIKLYDNKFLVIPPVLASYQSERYSLQIFDKIIAFKQRNKEKNVVTDDARREELFCDKLDILFNSYKYKKQGYQDRKYRYRLYCL